VDSISHTEQDESASLRLQMWREFARKLSENPLRWITGFGQLGPSYIGEQQVTLSGRFATMYSAHSEYVDVLLRSGVVGLGLVIALWGLIVYRGFSFGGTYQAERAVYFAHSAAFVGLAFFGLFQETLRWPTFGLYFWFYAGVVSATYFDGERSATVVARRHAPSVSLQPIIRAISEP
jgi:O-antigen ligase